MLLRPTLNKGKKWCPYLSIELVWFGLEDGSREHWEASQLVGSKRKYVIIINVTLKLKLRFDRQSVIDNLKNPQ